MDNHLVVLRMSLIGSVLGVLFWLLDSKVDSVLMGTSYLTEILSTEAGELWMRLFVLFSAIAFGGLAGFLISRAERAEEMSRRDREFSYAILNSMNEAVSVVDAGDFRIIDVNEAFLSEMGLAREEVIGKLSQEVMHRSSAPCSPSGAACPYSDTAGFGRHTTREHVHYSSDGRKIITEVSTNHIKDAEGEVIRVVHVSRNITARKAADMAMMQLSTAVETAADMIVITDHEGHIEYVNPAFESITGYTRAEAVGKTPRILKSGAHGEEFYRDLWNTILSGNIYRGIFTNRKKNGELYYDECTITPMRDRQNVITHFIATAKDITERILAEEKLRDYAERDFLTGLYNRRKFYELLEQEKERAVRYFRPLSLVMFDIDHFKAVNDTHGHAAGDGVLRTTASVVTDQIRTSDIMGRIGGEEFAVLATETTSENAMVLAEKIRCAVEAAEHKGVGKVTISIGISTYDSGLTLDEFVRRADEALYAAKNGGRNRVECYGAFHRNMSP